jgi:fatty acid desaturase
LIADPSVVPPPQPGALGLFLAAVGWVPAIVFPSATVFQLMAMARRGRADGVSILTWALFAIANVCLYLTIQEWTRPQVIISTLGAALLQAAVVFVALQMRAAAKAGKGPPAR